MKKSVPSKAEQIEAIEHDRARDLVLRYAWRDQSGRPRYREVFTITKKDVEDYVKEHYRLDNAPYTHSSPGREDGIYIIPVPGGYRVYRQERLGHFEEELVSSENAAWKRYVEYVILSGGTSPLRAQ